MSDDGWDVWRNHVLAEIKRMVDLFERHDEEDRQHRIKITEKIARLEVKAGIYSTVAGFLSILGYVIIDYLRK